MMTADAPRTRPAAADQAADQAGDMAARRKRRGTLTRRAGARLHLAAHPAMRLWAALLLAVSLVACRGGPAPQSGAASVLTQEVASGLPPQPGRYPVLPSSLSRDQQGVYQFAWLPPGGAGAATLARVSLLRLGQASIPLIEVTATGTPVLYLPADVLIPLAGSATGAAPARTSSYLPLWRPFSGAAYRGPAYYDPPSRALPPSGLIEGARISGAPAPPAERTIGTPQPFSGSGGGNTSRGRATRSSAPTQPRLAGSPAATP